MSSLVDPSGPWSAGRTPFKLDKTLIGRENPGWGTVTTRDQRMSASVRMYLYKLGTALGTQSDYFAVYGLMNHGIAHTNKEYQSYNPGPNWLSVGYYATDMSLVLELLTDGDVWDSGPSSTVGSNTTGFSLGGNLSAGQFGESGIAQVGVSASFSASFSSPDVSTGHSEVGKAVRWDIKLPGVGFISPAVPANPKPASYAGYQWHYGVIFEVPKGTDLELRVAPRVKWVYDNPRGTVNDTKTWEEDRIAIYQPA
jgi:hypothetical protein